MHQAKECIWHCIFFQQSFGKRLRARRIARLSISNNAVARTHTTTSVPNHPTVMLKHSSPWSSVQTSSSYKHNEHQRTSITFKKPCMDRINPELWPIHGPFLLKWREDKYHQPPKALLPELTTWASVDQVQKVTRRMSMSRQMSQVSHERCMPSRIC